MNINTHGGYCCGRGHISNFPSKATKVERKSFMLSDAEIYDLLEDSENAQDSEGSFCVEACLLDSQVLIWDSILKENGYTPVYRFTNPNTENNVTVYLSGGKQIVPTNEDKA